ncbi:uncharacterized protein LOC124457514 [Xenia sp. Carnegie-2017]|uniref:uncharacterized protein LOC124457514 n=1 Tax=Xenia sp. Carnegie-2017 TaxID=2897299 RepID=UPI001F03D8FF|nr:uncharacterized protein LOC124457514 [Xenia sp. Carnegie-2017]
MQTKEDRNKHYVHKIVTDVAKEKLVEFFIAKWNDKCKKYYGEWDNTKRSGEKLYNSEAGRSRPNKAVIQSNFRHGDTSLWDCTTLFDAILYSNKIGEALKQSDKKAWDAVDDLRNVRNKIIHDQQTTFSDFIFQDLIEQIEKSFLILKFSLNEIIELKTERNSFESFHVLPYKPNHYVFERTELRDQIINVLEQLRKDHNNELTYFYISGVPGSGKSQLARQVCEKLFKSYDYENETTFVWTLDGKDVNSLLETYRGLCYRLNCGKFRLNENLEEKLTITEKVEDLRSLLSTQIQFWKSWWIIVDNVVQLREIFPLLPKIGENEWSNGQIILIIQNTEAISHDEVKSKYVNIDSWDAAKFSSSFLLPLYGIEYSIFD